MVKWTGDVMSGPSFAHSKHKAKWNLCLSCKQNRYIVSRGLCMGCWKVPDIRERFKDKRLVCRNPMTAEHYLILSNPKQTEPTRLRNLAWRVVKRYGSAVDVADLIQEGYLLMCKCVKDFDPTWHNTLYKFCVRGITSEMERFARLQIRSSTMGTSHEDFIDFIDNDYLTRGLRKERYEVGHTFHISDHAIKRYIERIDPNGTRKKLKRIVEASKRIVPIEREELWLNREQYDSANREAREYGDIVLIMGPSLMLWSRQQVVLTVLPKKSTTVY